MSEPNTQDLTFDIPDYADLVDFTTDFAEFVGGMPQYTTVANKTEDVVVEETDINHIFDFNEKEENATASHNISFNQDGEYWKEVNGKGYGFQFGVVTENDQVTIIPEEGVSVVPSDFIPTNTFAIVTRISESKWLVVGGGSISTDGPFIFNKSLMGSADYYA